MDANPFYEKVVKVKADVAAILKFFLPMLRWRPTITTRPRWHPSGGCARGVSAERFETPLAGGAAAPMRASAFCWRAACQRRGGNPPAPAFPWRGKRERGGSNFLAAAGTSHWRGTDGRHAASGVCARSSLTFSSRFRSPTICRLRRSAFQKSCWHHPLLCRASIRTLNGPRRGPVQVGVRSKAQVHHHGDGPGLLGAAIFTAISAKDQWGSRSHPNKAVDVFANKTSKGLLASAINSCWLCSLLWLPECGCWEWLCLAEPWPATLLPRSARHGVAAHTLLR